MSSHANDENDIKENVEKMLSVYFRQFLNKFDSKTLKYNFK
jgi:hypothetical protein